MIVRKTKANNINDALKLIKTTGCDEYVHDKLASKMLSGVIIIDGINNKAANILKQDALSCGADAVISSDISKFKPGKSRAVICATLNQADKLSDKLKEQPFGLKELSLKIREINKKQKKRKILCGKKKIILNDKTLVMGIINLSPDSFFGNGIKDTEEAVNAACEMEKDGADIIDVGAESTRPGSEPVSVKEEILRITKFLKIFTKRTKLPISVDTYKPEVANAAMQEGANIINDIYALTYNKSKMAEVAARHNAGVVLMHMQGTPATMQKNIKYEDLILEIFRFLSQRADFALQKGIKKESIILDPGIGFGKTVEDNLLIIKKLEDFKSLNYPLLMGISNKSFLAKVADISELKERLIPSLTASALSVINGADIIRVHNVKETVLSLKVVEALRRI
ncbi:MAG: dihydropteroate synthase [Endomicrobiaceae bacterium]